MRSTLLLSALLLPACPHPVLSPPSVSHVCDAQAYTAAVRDAMEHTATDPSPELWAITPENPKLTWNEDQSAVRMVVWTGWTGYALGEYPATREIWVTAVPEVREMCGTFDTATLIPRMNQLLGLPPATSHDDNRYFVEMWVKPADLFRPCPDAEITDTRCDPEFPDAATPEHRAWIAANFANCHGFWQTTPYPWTGKGYTYDWCNPETVVGPSEFLVRVGSVVTVTGLFKKEEYCGGGG